LICSTVSPPPSPRSSVPTRRRSASTGWTLRRSIARDTYRKSEAHVIAHHRNRNMPAFDVYLAEADAVSRADEVIDNNDAHAPTVIRGESA
jgi:hypothetical protein